MADSDRVAELKRKMQERAQQAKAEQAAAEAAGQAAAPSIASAQTTPVEPTGALTGVSSEEAPVSGETAAVAVAVQPATQEPVEGQATGEAPAATALSPEPRIPEPQIMVAGSTASLMPQKPATNGDIPGEAYETHTPTPEELARRQMTRRELLTYAWAGALGLVLVGTGASTFFFMYPRFRAGEFGGKFYLGPASTMPTTDAPPQPNTSGKFWLVNTTDEGVKALYMVCTHLGCLYKWETSNTRFECPCHGSKFSREGYYIEGPAPRSLDRFEVSEENGVVVVDTGAKITGSPSTQSPARAVPA